MEAANEKDEPAHIQRPNDLSTEYISLEQRADVPPNCLGENRPCDDASPACDAKAHPEPRLRTGSRAPDFCSDATPGPGTERSKEQE